MPSSLGPAEIMVILVVALIVLGPTRLPEVGRQVGRALSEVRKWTQGMQSELREAIEAEPPRASATPSVPPSLPPPESTVVAAPSTSAGGPDDAPPKPASEGTAGETTV